MLIMCDIDGVLADAREFVSKYVPHDWDGYFACTNQFPSIEPVINMIKALEQHHAVFLVTGRPERNRELTYKWLDKALGHTCNLMLKMRSNNDHRPTHVMKLEYAKIFRPDLVIDDEPIVIEKLSAAGFLCLQVHGYRLDLLDRVPE